MAKQTKKRSRTTDHKTLEVRSKNTPAIATYAIGAVKENKMKIFKIITLIKYSTNVPHYKLHFDIYLF